MAEVFQAGWTSVKGHVGRDPVEKELEGGGVVVEFSLAKNKDSYNQEEQAWEKGPVTWYQVGVMKEELKDNVMGAVQKGQLVTVEGRHEVHAFQRKTGEAGLANQLYATDVSPSLARLPRGAAETAASVRSPEAVAEQQRQAQPQDRGPTADEQAAAEAIRQQAVQSWSQASTSPGLS